MPRRAERDENEDQEHLKEDTDCHVMQVNLDDEEMKKKKQRHRRRRERRHREKPVAYRDKDANDSAIDGAHDQRPYDPKGEELKLHPLKETEVLAKQLQASASLKQQKEAEQAAQAEIEADPSLVKGKPPQMSEISDDNWDDKLKKKKKKPKKQRKKRKKQRRRNSDDDLLERSDRGRMLGQGKEYPDKKDVGRARI